MKRSFSLAYVLFVLASLNLTAPILLSQEKAEKKSEPPAPVPAAVAVIDSAPAAPATPEFGGPCYSRTKLTGDWMGYRTDLALHGITIDASWTQFSQGVTSGGRQRDWVYGGHGDYFLNVDGEKAGLWKGFFVTMHAETRYGRDVNQFAGTMVPPNTTMLFPQPNTDITAITSLKFTQALSENFAVFGGKINVIDEFQMPFVGPRNESFMNTFILPPVMYRTLPYSTYGAGFAVLKDLQPVFTFMALDPNEHATTGPTRLYDGVVFLTLGTLPVNVMGRPGHQMIGGTWSNRSYKAVDRSSFAFIPGEGLQVAEKSQSWSLVYGFDQYLWVDPCNPKRGWGVFGMFGLSDGNPNPIRWSYSVGVGGNSPLRSRSNDTFGAAFYFVSPSDDFRDLLGGPIVGRVLGQQNEHGVELFYNIALTPYCKLTSDLQLLDPSTRRLSNAVVPGFRLKIDF